MIHLTELIEHRTAIDLLKRRSRVTQDEEKSLEIASQMFTALINQLENQAVSFTP